MNQISILTEPISTYWTSKMFLKKYIKKLPGNYGGHWSVTRSLLEGFNKIGFQEYNYRPKKRELCEHVHVLAGVETLKYGIQLKKQGIIKKLTVGPNVAGYPDTCNYIIADENIDGVLLPSRNTVEYFLKYIPDIRNKMMIFPSGVDSKLMEPTDEKRDIVLIYLKHVSDYWGEYLSFLLKNHGFSPVIIRYGSYVLEDYKKLLNRSKFMISISRHDTQGLYLAEAWAMNCPTICYNSEFNYFKKSETIITGQKLGSPYVCEENGITFRSIEDLNEIISNIDSIIKGCAPREWVLKHMTDEISAKIFLDLMGIMFET